MSVCARAFVGGRPFAPVQFVPSNCAAPPAAPAASHLLHSPRDHRCEEEERRDGVSSGILC
eukprot:12890361-Prorocentrum_lima.AAC.1